jgi:hypothetical protein
LGDAVAELVGFGVGLGEAVAELVGFGVGLGEAVAELVGFGVGETVGVVSTGTDPKKVKSSKTPVGVFSNDASTAVAGAVPLAGTLEAK